MTLPNKITLGRLVLTPLFFFAFFYTASRNYPMVWMIFLWGVVLISEVSDILDGHIARKRGLVSDIGKVMDPFADVISRVTYFVCYTWVGLMPLWCLMLILWREFSIMFIRIISAKEGVALAAQWGGKIKAGFYFTAGFFALLA